METTIATKLQRAIDRSRSHDEIAAVDVEAVDIATVLAELGSLYDAEIDYSRENDGSYDIWGCDADSPNGDMDWRINVMIDPTATAAS